jgi:hypothetical protein
MFLLEESRPIAVKYYRLNMDLYPFLSRLLLLANVFFFKNTDENTGYCVIFVFSIHSNC